MAALPDFGDISIIPQERSGLYEETIRQDHHDTTTVDDTQSQSLLHDLELQEKESQSQSQSQSLLHDIVMEHDANGESEALPMDEEQSPDPDSIADEDVNNENDDDFIEEIDLEPGDEDETEAIGEGDSENISDETEDVLILENTEDVEEGSGSEKLFHLPLSKIKRIMKTDEDTNLISKEALVAISVCTELFVSLIAQNSYKIAAASKKKTVAIQHVKTTLTSSPIFDFLEGALPEYEL